MNLGCQGRIRPRPHLDPVYPPARFQRACSLLKTRLGILGGAAAIVLMTAVAYLPALHAGFVWDDDIWVETNSLLAAQDGLWRIWFSMDQPSQYFPMVYTSFRLEHAFWGLDPFGYHLTNIALHASNAMLIWLLLFRLGMPGAWVAAALWAVHPVNAESVVWITERKNVLMTFFFLLSLWAWLGFVDRSSRSRRAWPIYSLSLGLYVAALLSKTTACTLPAALVLTLWLQRRPVSRARWLQLAPYVVLGAAMGLLTMWWERHHQGTTPAMLAMNPIERALVASHAVWFYLGKLLWPATLSFSYPKWKIDPADPFQYAWLAACLAAAAGMWLGRERIGRAPVAAIVFFVATLAPTLGFIMLLTFLYTFVADHYQYVACIGPVGLLAGAGASFARRSGWRRRTAAAAGLFVLLAVLAGLTWRQGLIYKDRETLWRDTIRKNPDSFMAHTNLATLLRSEGNVEEAIVHFRRALELGSAERGVHSQTLAHLHYNLANALRMRPDGLDEAVAHYRLAIAAEPGYVLAHSNLGNVFFAQGKISEAIDAYRRALQLDPRYADGHYNLGVALESLGKKEEAIEQYLIATRLAPRLVEEHPRLAGVASGAAAAP